MLLLTSPSSAGGICQSAGDFYRQGQFCDLTLVPGKKGGGGEESKVLRCHRLVLASVSPAVRRILSCVQDDGDSSTVLLLPDFDLGALSLFLDQLYSLLSGGIAKEEDVLVPEDLATELELDLKGSRSTAEEELVDEEEVEESETFQEEEEDWKEAVQVGEEDDLAFKEEFLTPYKPRIRNRKRRPPKRLVEGDSDGDNKEDKTVPVKRRRSQQIYHVDGRHRDPERAEELYRKMCQREGDSLMVDLQGEHFDGSKTIGANVRYKTVFQAMLGVARTVVTTEPKKPVPRGKRRPTTTVYSATPLAWNLSREDEDATCQYRDACAAFQAVFGLSRVEAFYDYLVYARQGIARQNPIKKERFEQRRRYKDTPKEELQARLDSQEMSELSQRGEGKAQMAAEAGRAELELRRMSPEEMEGIVFVAFAADGGGVGTGHVMKVEEATRKADVAGLQKGLFELWSRVVSKPKQGDRGKSSLLEMPKTPDMIQVN